MESPVNSILVAVTITPNADGTYSWGYESDYEGLDSKSGKITVKETGVTKITYALMSEGYGLIYVNLDADVCATREIHNVAVDTANNSITLTDGNTRVGQTGNQPFSLRLIARVGDDTNAAIISPDPEVENDPGDHSPAPPQH